MGKEKDILERHLLENPEEHKEAMELITGRRWDIDPASFRHYPVHSRQSSQSSPESGDDWLFLCLREGRQYTVNRGEIHHPVWTIKGLAHLSGMEIDDEELLKISGSKEECTMELAYTFLSKEQAEAALQQGFQQGEVSGIRKGESEGRKRAHQLFSWLHKQDRISEYPQALSSEQLFEQYWNEMQSSLKN
ncbi:hypothetical protein [uncultured Faecalibaculum sp.]|uniref:hypothetical protein n=2 Tax=uncultured Faecalibaculum sp. TaxID=1729681 RepID=UPI002626D645|nr:hypothetical protein [uncultured Faecalibaculum sp.]